MSQVVLRDELLAAFQDLKKSFDSSLADASKLDEEFNRLHFNFERQSSELFRKTLSGIPSNHPLKDLLVGIAQQLSETNESWSAKLLQHQKGCEFRKDFEDSLLVFVFGKVKSGKSSLGNYMAWGNTDPVPELKCQIAQELHPEYFSAENTGATNGDAVNEAVSRQEFRVGATEATSSIQGFRLPGLTWVDSPGVHSVNAVNGNLAKEYVKHSDLILYTMRSDAPGRKSDMDEIRRLKKQGKEILILVTGSDCNHEEWDDELEDVRIEVQMKSVETRQLQRDYIVAELTDIGSNEILSISTRFAQNHPENPEKMKDSGIAQLFSVLQRISTNDGIRLKRNVPLHGIRSFLDSCLDDVAPYSELIARLEEDTEKYCESAKKTMQRKKHEAKTDLNLFIDNAFRNMSHFRNNESAMNSNIRKMRHDLNAELSRLIGNALETGLQEISSEVVDASHRTWSTKANFLPRFKVEKVTEKISDGVQKSTKGRNGGIASLCGAVVGFAVGGPVVSGIASFVGNLLGNASGEDAKVLTRDIEIEVGDNLEELRAECRRYYGDLLEQTINEYSQRYINNELENMKMLTKNVKENLEKFNQGIATIRLEAESKLL